jgi:hypothetical protein
VKPNPASLFRVCELFHSRRSNPKRKVAGRTAKNGIYSSARHRQSAGGQLTWHRSKLHASQPSGLKDAEGDFTRQSVLRTTSSEEMRRLRNILGNLSQTILAACDFNMCSLLVFLGWEGSIPDGRDLKDALGRDFEVPSRRILSCGCRVWFNTATPGQRRAGPPSGFHNILYIFLVGHAD